MRGGFFLNPGISRPAVLLLCLWGTLAFFSACSRSEPTISYGFISLVYYQGLERPEERFSFFVIPNDDDGIENLADLYLYHDREQLRWHIQSGDWITHEQDGQTWIGTRAIAMTGDESLPRGQFRAVLVNKGGEQSERLFSFDAPAEPRFPFPLITITGGRYRINSNYPVNKFICYDEQGNMVTVITMATVEGQITDLNLSPTVRAAALWAEDPAYYTSVLTDVVPLR
ncbi:MAG: hypothetical protein LBK27_03025 [Treponema sp.]|nr:hypothetical protein [Treponema sp.]